MDIIEITGVILGILCVWYTVKQNILCWPTGLIQVFIYIYIFYEVKLYSDLILQIFYVFFQIYGWHYWLHGGKNKSKVKVTRLSLKGLVFWVLASLFGTWLLGYFMATYTDAALPYADAFTTIASLVAQWLLTKKKLESWVFWISVDIIAVWVYFMKELYLTSGLYSIFLCLAILGLLQWKKSFKLETQEFKPLLNEG